DLDDEVRGKAGHELGGRVGDEAAGARVRRSGRELAGRVEPHARAGADGEDVKGVPSRADAGPEPLPRGGRRPHRDGQPERHARVAVPGTAADRIVKTRGGNDRAAPGLKDGGE